MILSELILTGAFIVSLFIAGKYVYNQLKEKCYSCDYACPVKQLKEELKKVS